MTDKPKPKKKAKYYSPQNSLRLKAGYGGIETSVMERAEELIVKNDIDFTNIFEAVMGRLDKSVAAVRKEETRGKDQINRIAAPMMEMKANGAMFRYPLISDVADIALDFLENLNELNDDAFNIVDIHRQTLRTILLSNLKGTGGKQGDALIRELNEACARYHKKYHA
ncbi:MAG: hypothetical protein ACK4NR_10115 [Micavibrio sp.]